MKRIAEWLREIANRLDPPPRVELFEIKNPRLEIARRRRERLQRKAREL